MNYDPDQHVTYGSHTSTATDALRALFGSFRWFDLADQSARRALIEGHGLVERLYGREIGVRFVGELDLARFDAVHGESRGSRALLDFSRRRERLRKLVQKEIKRATPEQLRRAIKALASEGVCRS